MRLPVKPGNQLVMLLSPENDCVLFENLTGTLPLYCQAFINEKERLLFIRRCSIRGKEAGELDPTEDGKTFRLANSVFMDLLYRLIGSERMRLCRIQGVEEAFNGSNGFLFDLKAAEFLEPALDN